MKSYLINKRRQKEKSLKAINDLQKVIGTLNNKCIDIDSCVKIVTYGIQSSLKGDNTGSLSSLSANINKNNYRKINESISLASTAKVKIQSEIDSIDRQIREIERREEAERRQMQLERERRRREEEERRGR
ncbi:hypothetical protein E5347_13510 [Clostridium sartagoforme]|uniref:Uncharacterized protein n=1 Tax=Clostridium sartagoforme TaxID=84031 RepID=A0A4S2DHZ3_9CLOT|nr:hypothetical protein [Clostridium sartagoforme]TGY41182.1 hypothetical protein E5347_13510 [Clostridium sartagoforme]